MATAINALPATDRIKWTGRSGIKSTADGYITLFDNAETAFTGLRFGGSTSAFPMLLRSGATLEVKLADDSAYANMSMGTTLTLGPSGPQLKGNVGGTGSLQIGSDCYIGEGGTGGTAVKWLGFVASGSPGSGPANTHVRPDADGILAQRNSTNAQVFRVYNTYTSGSVYEAFRIDWQASANSCIIGTTTVGGSQRDLLVQGATIYFMPSSVTKAFVNSSTFGLSEGVNVQVGTSTGTKIGSSATQKLGFWNATPVVQQVLATGASATVDDVITFLQTIGLCKQS